SRGGVAVGGGGGWVPLLVMGFALVPVTAARRPPGWDARLVGMVLRASVARSAGGRPNPLPATEENLSVGAEIYTQMCAKCHGKPNAGPSVYGASFYPPAPRLAAHSPVYTEAELFWIAKHGTGNTAMPAWGRQLSDENIWQVVAFLKRLDSLSVRNHSQMGEGGR